MFIRLCLAAFLAAILSGCSSTAQHLRSQPAMYFPPAAKIVVPEDIKQYVDLRCMRVQDMNSAVGSTLGQECIYASADAAALTATPTSDAVRNKTINFLIGVSDMNCSNFLHRAFANKAGLDFTKTFASDMATGISAGTAHASPAISAAVGVGNLIIGKGVDSFNATYYYEKTFQALKSVIAAKRSSIKSQIIAKQSQSNEQGTAVRYALGDAISDIREYDDACSIMNGLDQLVQVAGTEQKKEDAAKKSVEIATNPAEEQIRQLQLK